MQPHTIKARGGQIERGKTQKHANNDTVLNTRAADTHKNTRVSFDLSPTQTKLHQVLPSFELHAKRITHATRCSSASLQHVIHLQHPLKQTDTRSPAPHTSSSGRTPQQQHIESTHKSPERPDPSTIATHRQARQFPNSHSALHSTLLMWTARVTTWSSVLLVLCDSRRDS